MVREEKNMLGFVVALIGEFANHFGIRRTGYLSVLNYPDYSEEWALFVLANRIFGTERALQLFKRL